MATAKQKQQLAVLFTDVVDHTKLLHTAESSVIETLYEHDREVAAAIVAFGGRVVNTIGDSVLAVFPRPDGAVHAAMDALKRLSGLRRRISVRIGIHYGHVYALHHPQLAIDYRGINVCLAARVTSDAKPGHIQVTAAVRETISDDAGFLFTDLGQREYKGFAAPVGVFDVVWNSEKPVDDWQPAGQSELLERYSIEQPTDVQGERFEILQELGRGGMGVVYSAWDKQLHELTALKVMHAKHADDEEWKVRFRREAQAARTIAHPNVCRIHDLHEHKNALCISMEFVDGRTLRQMMKQQAFQVPEAARLLIPLCQGLHAMHVGGLIHRDLKPENIMITATGKVKVMDFGLARFVSGTRSDSSSIKGTFLYMSPEQSRGETDMDKRSDIYSLGTIIYEMFVGRTPFEPEDRFSPGFREIVFYRRATIDPEPLLDASNKVPQEFETIILRCLKRRRDERYGDIPELERDIELLVRNRTVVSVASHGVESGREKRTSARMDSFLLGGYVVAYCTTWMDSVERSSLRDLISSLTSSLALGTFHLPTLGDQVGQEVVFTKLLGLVTNLKRVLVETWGNAPGDFFLLGVLVPLIGRFRQNKLPASSITSLQKKVRDLAVVCDLPESAFAYYFDVPQSIESLAMAYKKFLIDVCDYIDQESLSTA